MDNVNASISVIERRSFDRLINFTDAVVAIAITLQLLPLVDIKIEKGESALALFADNSSQIIAFCFSFVVLSVLWLKHNQVFNAMRTFDPVIFWLNTAWMALIVFLPLPTSLYGTLNDNQTVNSHGIGLLYWWTLAAISGIGWLVARHAWRKPELLEESVVVDRKDKIGFRNHRGVSFFTAFLLIGIAAEFMPQWGPYLGLCIIPMDLILRRQKRQSIASKSSL